MRSLPKGKDPNKRLYPDLIAAGSLAHALRGTLPLAEATRLDVHEGGSRWSAIIVSDTAHRGDFSVYIGADERTFGVAGWNQGVMLISGETGELAAAGAAARSWHAGASLEALRQRHRFLDVTPLALAHERGPADAVAEQWRQLGQSWRADDRFQFVAEIIDAAHPVPALRQLFAYTSHASLHFSTCTGFPYSQDIPYIDPQAGSGYIVHDPISREMIGEAANAQQAIDILLKHLPPNLGPAVAGTADFPRPANSSPRQRAAPMRPPA